MRSLRLVLTLSVIILFAGQVYAFDCPDKPPPVQLSHDVKNQVKASVGKIASLSAGELSIQTEVAAKNLYANFPNVDQLVIAQAMISTYCSMLKDANISDTEKLNRWERFQANVMKFSGTQIKDNDDRPGPQDDFLSADKILDKKFKTPFSSYPPESRYSNEDGNFVSYEQYVFGKKFKVRQEVLEGVTSTANLERETSGGWEGNWGNLTGETRSEVRSQCSKTSLKTYTSSLGEVYGFPVKVSPEQESEKSKDIAFPNLGWFTYTRTRGVIWKVNDGSQVLLRQRLKEYIHRGGVGKDNPWSWECKLEICVMPKSAKKPCFELPGVIL